MKEIIYFDQAINAINKFPKQTRIRIAVLLDMLKEGIHLQPKDFKPLPSVGKGVNELRIRMGMQYRVFYIAKFKNRIYVLHAFNKKKQANMILSLVKSGMGKYSVNPTSLPTSPFCHPGPRLRADCWTHVRPSI